MKYESDIGIIKFTNLSKTHKMWVMKIPEKPKRKLVNIFVLEPESFKILELRGYEIELDKIAFYFERVKPD